MAQQPAVVVPVVAQPEEAAPVVAPRCLLDLPQALVDLITDFVIKDTRDWKTWTANHDRVKDEMKKEPCACSTLNKKFGGYCFDPFPTESAACRLRNNEELYRRCGGSSPYQDRTERIMHAFSWDAVCTHTRVHNQAWKSLLVQECTSDPCVCIATPENALAILNVNAKSLLRRMRLKCRPQLMADMHRAILLDDADAFVSVARQCPPLILGCVKKRLGGLTLALWPTDEHHVTIDERVREHVEFTTGMLRVPRCTLFSELFYKVSPENIRKLGHFEMKKSGINDDSDLEYDDSDDSYNSDQE